VSVGVVLNQWFEVNIEVGEDPREKSHVGWEIDFDLSAGDLREEIAPAAVSEKKHDSLCSVSAGQLKPLSQLGNTNV
jgi:hypothetical protein